MKIKRFDENLILERVSEKVRDFIENFADGLDYNVIDYVRSFPDIPEYDKIDSEKNILNLL